MDTVDFRAQKRLDFALMLKERGDDEGALSLFRECLDLAPEWPTAHFAFAEVLEGMGLLAEAAGHYVEYLRLADEDAMGAEVRLALIGSVPVPDTLPEPYVRALFDDYADRFEQSVLVGLEYRGPQFLRRAVDALRAPQAGGERILDLGCGTGLGGEAFADRAAWLVGCDLSPGMIAKADQKNLYHALHVGDALAALTGNVETFDLILAADVLVYIGDLSALFAAVQGALPPGGLFAFSVETTMAEDFRLGEKCRYAHHPDYLRRLADETGLLVMSMQEVVCRRRSIFAP